MGRDTRTVLVDKERVERHFARGITTYDEEAKVQTVIAQRLVEMAESLAHGTVLEIGCGTGILSELLCHRLSGCDFVLNDLSSIMEIPLRQKVGPGPTFLSGDAERMVWPGHCTLIASASCIQWWEEPLNFFPKAFGALREGGQVIFSTFLPENMWELRQVTDVGLEYPSREQIYKTMVDTGFRDIRLEYYKQVLYFPTLLGLLRHLKRTGTNSLSTGEKWTAGRLEDLEVRYKDELHLSSVEPLPLTYVGLLGTGRR